MNQKETVNLLQNLLFSENKPEELRPIDVALLTYLILRQTEDHFIYDSQLTLANRLGCKHEAIADSTKRLETMGWIVIHKAWNWSDKTKRKTRSIGKTTGLSVNLAKLPQEGTPHSQPSPEAVELAAQHTAILIKLGRSAKQQKNFDRQQEYAAQRLIDEMGGYDAAVDILNFAISEVRFQKTVAKSLYAMRVRLPAIKRAYANVNAVPAVA